MEYGNFRLPEGLSDYLPRECAQKNLVEERLLATFLTYGFRRVETPVFEYSDAFTKSGAELTQLFKFSDTDGSLLALRPDMTLPIARIAATKCAEGGFPSKFSYAASSYTLQNGINRDREFSQAGVEVIGGVSSPYADAELIALAAESLKAVGLDDFLIEIGHVGLLRELSDAARPYDFFGGVEVLTRARTGVKTAEASRAVDELFEVYAVLKSLGLEGHICFDLSISGSADYYTGIVFNGMTGLGGTNIVGGGRYVLGDVSGSGFAVGIRRLMQALARGNALPFTVSADVAIGCAAGLESKACLLAKELRYKGKLVDNTFITDKRALGEYAAKIGAKETEFVE